MDNDFGRPSSSNSNNNNNNNYNSSSTNSRYTSSSSSATKTSSYSNGGGADNGDASKRFANAKAISSDQYFGRSNLNEDETNKSRLDKFQGSSSISSEDYFGDGSRKKSSGGSSYGVSSYTAPDMTAIKQDLKEGVTRVAGRLSNMASNVMSSFQDRM